jgi:hypothetical protein
MASMFGCCAAPSTSAAVETVPMDFSNEPRSKVPTGYGETSLVAKVDATPKKRVYDVRDDSPQQSRFHQMSNSDTRFARYDNQLSTPDWDKDDVQKSWVPTRSRRNDNMGSPREENKEQRLKELMVEFRPMLASGIRVDVIDAGSQLFSQCLLKMDMASQSVHMTSAFMHEQIFSIKDMAIFKGNEFARKVPQLAHTSAKCVGVEVQDDYGNTEPICLHFEETAARNDFYAFMKIMRMTAESVGPSNSRR